MKKVIALVLALVMVFALCACGSSDSGSSTKAASSDEKVVKIGVFEPTSGQNAAGGKKEILGIEYAHSLNPTIDINGETYNIELVYADNASDAAKAPSAAQLLISNNVSVVIGTYGSGCAIAAGDLFAEAKIPAIGTSCTNPQVTLGNDYYFRIAYIDPFQGAVMASYALKNGCKNCVVIVEAGDDYSAGFGNYFSEAMVNGGASCDTVTFQTGETDFSTIMANIKSKGYDGIFAPVSIETAPLIINQAREAGVDCQIMAGDTWDDISIAERAGRKRKRRFLLRFLRCFRYEQRSPVLSSTRASLSGSLPTRPGPRTTAALPTLSPPSPPAATMLTWQPTTPSSLHRAPTVKPSAMLSQASRSRALSPAT